MSLLVGGAGRRTTSSLELMPWLTRPLPRVVRPTIASAQMMKCRPTAKNASFSPEDIGTLSTTCIAGRGGDGSRHASTAGKCIPRHGWMTRVVRVPLAVFRRERIEASPELALRTNGSPRRQGEVADSRAPDDRGIGVGRWE